jgi:hypothetical protein
VKDQKVRTEVKEMLTKSIEKHWTNLSYLQNCRSWKSQKLRFSPIQPKQNKKVFSDQNIKMKEMSKTQLNVTNYSYLCLFSIKIKVINYLAFIYFWWSKQPNTSITSVSIHTLNKNLGMVTSQNPVKSEVIFGFIFILSNSTPFNWIFLIHQFYP